MEWICGIALYMVISGLLLELIADTKYYRYAKWVAGVFLILQFAQPLGQWKDLGLQFFSKLTSFDYALGTDRILEELYETEDRRTQSVLEGYKAAVTEQIEHLLGENGLRVRKVEPEILDNGELAFLTVTAQYLDGTEEDNIRIPTVVPVRITKEDKEPEVVSPMELYIRELLAEFYQMDENNIVVVIQEAD